MTTTTSSAAALVVDGAIAELFVTPMLAASVAAQVSTAVTISSGSLRVPRVRANPSAEWVAEGQEIPVSDAAVDEVEIIPRKLAGLVVITRELADDSSPQAGEIVGLGLARDCARKIDQAFFGALAAPAPSGLGALTGITEISGGAEITNLDAFQAGLYAAAGRNASVTSWIANPSDALSLSQLKQSGTSNVSLLTPDATAAGRSLIAGVSLLVSPSVPAGTIYGLDASTAFTVLRDDVQIESDSSAFFTSDRIAIRARTRLAFGWPDPAAVVRITVGA